MKIQLKKKTEIIETVESTYGISRRVYQHLYADIADMFIEYMLIKFKNLMTILKLMAGEQKLYLKLKMLLSCYLFFNCFIILMEGST